jgi:glycosyltransferase involved in cell wall biosynthesis
VKQILRPAAKQILMREERKNLELANILFPTSFMQKEFENVGLRPQKARAVYGAIDTSSYKDLKKKSRNGTGLYLLYIGRLTEEKGVHTAIEALGHLYRRTNKREWKLTIVGNGEPDYETRLRQLAKSLDVELMVTFIPSQPKENLPAFYQQADIFLFTSIWPEPFGRVIVEAMASGVAVVGTGTGGSAEIMSDHENALLFTPGSSKDLADKLQMLVESSALRKQLSDAGRATALAKFDIQSMIAGIEDFLQTLIAP